VLNLSRGSISNVRWQRGSLEYQLAGIMNQGITRQLAHVVKQLYRSKEKRNAGWAHCHRLVLHGLASRNLVSVSANFNVVQVARALAKLPAEETIEPLQQLLNENSAHRQAVWTTLQSEIETGIAG
jgi:hypothetical protein